MKAKIIVCLMLTGFVWALPILAVAQMERPTVRYAEEDVIKQKNYDRKTVYECGDRKPIRVAGFVTNPPFGWMDIISGNTLNQDRYVNDGFGYQLFLKMANEMNLKVEGVGFKSYYEAVNALKTGQIDVLLGAYYDKRVLGVGTSILFPGYFSNPVVVVFLKGNERPVNSYEDLKGLKGLIRQEEGLYSLIYQGLPKDVQIEQVSGARKAYTMLLEGKADYMISSLYAIEAEIRRFKITDKVSITTKPLLSPELFFVFGSNSECLVLKPMFAEKLTQEKQNQGNINQILFKQVDKWIERFRYAPPLAVEISSGIGQNAPREVVEDLRFEN